MTQNSVIIYVPTAYNINDFLITLAFVFLLWNFIICNSVDYCCYGKNSLLHFIEILNFRVEYMLLNEITEMFQHSFMIRALVGGTLVSLCASLLGVSLVLKRYSMIGDGLSHVGFGSLAVASAVGCVAPLEVAIPVVVIAAFFLLRLSENSKIKGDAAIALISTSALAIGITAASMTTGLNTDINSYLFGSIIAMNGTDVILCSVLSAVILVMFVFFYNKIFAVTFDENFAKATGTRAGVYNMIIALLTALTIVIGMKMMGSMLISSLIIFPAVISMRMCKRFKTVMITSAVVSVICFFVGLAISYLYSTPTGASIVIVNLCVLIIFTGIGFVTAKISARKYI